MLEMFKENKQSATSAKEFSSKFAFKVAIFFRICCLIPCTDTRSAANRQVPSNGNTRGWFCFGRSRRSLGSSWPGCLARTTFLHCLKVMPNADNVFHTLRILTQGSGWSSAPAKTPRTSPCRSNSSSSPRQVGALLCLCARSR